MTPTSIRIGTRGNITARWKGEIILGWLRLTLSLRRWRSCLGMIIISSPPLVPSVPQCTPIILYPRGNSHCDVDDNIISHRVSFSSTSSVVSWLMMRHSTDGAGEADAPPRPSISWMPVLPRQESSFLSSTQLLATAATPNSYSTTTTTTTAATTTTSQPSFDSSDCSTTTWRNQILNTPNYQLDKVERIIDATTIRLQNNGNISLQTVRGAGSTSYKLPDCMTYSPSHKLKLLLPRGTAVRLINLEDVTMNEDAMMSSSSSAASTKKKPSSLPSSSAPTTPARQLWIVRESDKVLINEELVRTGFAFVRGGGRGGGGAGASSVTRSSKYNDADSLIDTIRNDLIEIERHARKEGLGIFRICDDSNQDGATDEAVTAGGGGGDGGASESDKNNFVAEFEPMEYTTEIQYGDDGGKSVIRPRETGSASSSPSILPPENPGDVKGCSDFRIYEDALRWYETYLPYYGDVANLDRDGDGVPCPGLPHTKVREHYRMKKRG